MHTAYVKMYIWHSRSIDIPILYFRKWLIRR